jgi:4-alpha-glucanotransferase
MEMTDRDGYEKPVEGVDAGKPVEGASKRAELGATV